MIYKRNMLWVITSLFCVVFVPLSSAAATIGTWKVSGVNYTCILLNSQIDMQFTNAAGNVTTVTVPASAEATGDCKAMTMTLTWSMGPENATTTSTLGFIFADVNVNDTSRFHLTQLTSSDAPAIVDTIPAGDTSFSALVNTAYFCVNGDTQFSFNNSTSGAEVTQWNIDFKHLQVQYNSDAAHAPKDFVKGMQCKDDDKTSDLVPIIVGACLALLVIIVLVAYLIGRVRAKRQGYASV